MIMGNYFGKYMSRHKYKIGDRVNNLVITKISKDINRKMIYICRCDCGCLCRKTSNDFTPKKINLFGVQCNTCNSKAREASKKDAQREIFLSNILEAKEYLKPKSQKKMDELRKLQRTTCIYRDYDRITALYDKSMLSDDFKDKFTYEKTFNIVMKNNQMIIRQDTTKPLSKDNHKLAYTDHLNPRHFKSDFISEQDDDDFCNKNSSETDIPSSYFHNLLQKGFSKSEIIKMIF